MKSSKMKLKHISSMAKIVLAIAILFTLYAMHEPAPAPTFSDVPVSEWYYAWVEKAYDLGLLSGYPDGTFRPGAHVSYAEFAALMVNTLHKEEGASQPQGSQWWEPACNVANKHLLWVDTDMQDADWNVVADKAINREQMAQVIYNALRNTDKLAPLADVVEAQHSIKDFDSINTRNCFAVAECYAIGLLTGTGDGYFSPADPMDRAQAATVVCKIYALMTGDASGDGEVKPVDPDPVEPTNPSTERPEGAVGGQYDVNVYDVPADTNKDGWITEAEVQAVLDQLRIDYPTGSPWGSNDRWSSPVMGNGIECAGFAYMVSDKIFGTLPRYVVSIEDTRVGDVLVNGPAHHTNVVLNDYGKDVFEGVNYTDSYTTVDGNVNGRVRWDIVHYYEDWPAGTGGTSIYSRYPKE